MKYCLKCGAIYAESYDEYERETCENCGMILTIDENTTEEQFLQMSDDEKDMYEDNIHGICKKSEFFSEESFNRHTVRKGILFYWTFRFDKYEELTGEKAYTKENDTYHTMKFRERMSEAVPQYYQSQAQSANIPKCPTCQSTNIRKMGGVERGASIWAFGLFSKKINKTFKCQNCGMTF